jgi:4-aminobutyrate aminotransferase-like enzyme/Ser/Thr protein kinase RdoA (MazF antagonist)
VGGPNAAVAAAASYATPPGPILLDVEHELAEKVRTHWGLVATAEPLPGETDLNYLLTGATGERYVLKLAADGTSDALLALQDEAVARLVAAGTRFRFPRPVPSLAGAPVVALWLNGTGRLARVHAFVAGEALAHARPHSPELLRDVGSLAGTIDRVLADFTHPAARRTFDWDLRRAPDVIARRRAALDAEDRALIDRLAPVLEGYDHFDDALRRSIIHGDANDYNVLVRRAAADAPATVAGIIDFGDMVETWTVAELAIACAYAMLDKDDPVRAAADVVAGYDAELALDDAELDALHALIVARLCTSLVQSAHQRALQPENAYLSISTVPVRALLGQLTGIKTARATAAFRAAAGRVRSGGGDALATPALAEDPDVAEFSGEEADTAHLLARRVATINPALSVAYRSPLVIVRGWRQHLYDADGRAYLDAVNNVAHVGHCHPRVTEALARQASVLNTNTRYLHPLLVKYAERLTATLPAPLSVCTFVCSGSEANELALRMARAHTGRHDVIVLDAAYHGNTSSLVELSPYKFARPGGAGRADHVHVAPLPDPYRGAHRGDDAGARYADDVRALVADLVARGRPPAAFFAEPLPGCGGQIVPPAGFLRAAFDHVRAAGGVCVGDEVQTGLGRVGTHFWAFETQDAVPDIVTVGKPIGNGHPLGAVITTPAIARSFDNGMEYFNTFGGNPVSCTVGLAVLDVIADEALQANALRVGDRLLAGLRAIAREHDVIGDVRGRGLYLGVELVRDPATRAPAGALATDVVNAMRQRGILLSTDGPDENVLKIKPPLVFTTDDADRLVETLDAVLAR